MATNDRVIKAITLAHTLTKAEHHLIESAASLEKAASFYDEAGEPSFANQLRIEARLCREKFSVRPQQ